MWIQGSPIQWRCLSWSYFYDESGIIRNDDFNLVDLDTAGDSGRWLKGAETRNYRHNSELGKIEMNDTSHDPKMGDNVELGLSFTESVDTMDVVYIASLGTRPGESKQTAGSKVQSAELANILWR